MDKLYSNLEDLNLNNIHAEIVPIPVWERGFEEAYMITPRRQKIAIVGLVQSAPTPPGGITSEIVIIPSFAFAKQNKALLKGKILIFDFQGENKRNFRLRGGKFALSHGGLAAIGRSFVTFSLNTVTARTYLTPEHKIPIACISDEDVDLFVRLKNKGINVTLTLRLDNTVVNDTSRNIMGDYIGRENGFPKEVILMNSHVDTFGLSQGGQDNACGCILALKVIQLIQALAIRPRRTIRALFTVSGEINYLGSRQYLQAHQAELPSHAAVLIADAGCGTDMGFIFHQNFPHLGCLLREIGALFEKTFTYTVTGESFTSGDVFSTVGNLPSIDFNGDDGRFYWIRHTYADTVAHLDPHKLDDILIFWTTTVLIMADLSRRVQDLGVPLGRLLVPSGNSTNPAGNQSRQEELEPVPANVSGRIKPEGALSPSSNQTKSEPSTQSSQPEVTTGKQEAVSQNQTDPNQNGTNPASNSSSSQPIPPFQNETNQTDNSSSFPPFPAKNNSTGDSAAENKTMTDSDRATTPLPIENSG